MTQLSRRDFLKLSAGLTATAAALAACQPLANTATPAATLAPPSTAIPTSTPVPQTETQIITRTLRRLMFAPKPDDYTRAKQLGLEKFIDEQLTQPTADDPEVTAKIKDLTTLTMSASDLLDYDADGKRAKPAQELTRATVLRGVYSRYQLYEVMVDFWTNHFNIYIGKGLDRYLKPADDREVIRKYTLTKFVNLLSASAHSAAMMFYLDNAESTKNKPNENYARELLELHTLGVDGGYTQQDVQELARVLTGWGLGGRKSPKPGEFEYHQQLHDIGSKTILGAKYDNNGQKEGELVLEALAKHRSTASYLAKKLVTRFVADPPPPLLIAKTAKTYIDTNGEMPKVLKTIFTSDEFRASLGQKFKRPYEFLVSALRVTKAQVDPGTLLNFYLNQMGQPLFQWATPDGYPDEAAAWATTTGMLTRWNFAIALCSNTLKEAKVDLTPFTKEAKTVDEAIEALSLAFLGEKLPDDAKGVLAKYAGGANVKAATPMLAGLIIGSPYFQYR